jgi:uncharacterized repeat protein (TIGR01451 family)
VILGGDDMTAHGSFDGTDTRDGWFYIQRALENVSPNVKRANDNSIAALGSTDGGGGAGEAIKQAAAKVALPVNYHDGAANIDQFFDDLAAGNVNPRIIWIAGSDAGNDLVDGDDCTQPSPESQALTDNASRINDFVNQGGGLISHGTCYQWLQALLPNAETYSEYGGQGSGGGNLYLTPEGQAAFPGITTQNINAGPWHNHFQGDLGGLQVLARSSDRQTENYPPPTNTANVFAAGQQAGTDVPVIIGGAGVSLTQRPTDLAITKQDTPDPVGVGQELTYALTVTNNGSNSATNVTITDDLPVGMTFVRSNSESGTCEGTGPVVCNVGTLDPGQSRVVAIVATASGAGTVTNVARVGSDAPDPDDSNNEARADTAVTPVAAECPDNRAVRFRTHHAPGNRIVRVRVFVNGELIFERRTKKGDIKRFRIRRLPQTRGTVVRIILNHSNGTKVTSTRVYNKCGKTTPRYKIKRKRRRG